ncbi:MAG: FAD-dependent oxidoreductase [Actinobacteria bacterium]|uniref:Unannotated protein n=1 Tax=freshwater metagenome TaxID=449393 RepID=A0A6J5YY26_9ZZZZ|nr:FAD-dependent oxidoreductase [Actinomycetota bacterium]
MREYTHIVIGKGLIGTAAAKYLAQSGDSVLIIGPDEPKDFTTSRMFASHYDQARVQRVINFSPMWTRLSVESTQAWPELQKATGIQFHNGAGCVYVAEETDSYLASVPSQAKEFGLNYTEISSVSDVANFSSAFHFDRPVVGIHEDSPAGTINPRALVLAQLAAAEQSGCHVHRHTATSVTDNDGRWEINTSDGSTFIANNIIVASGSFSNFNSLLPVTLDILVKSEVVILAEVSESTANSLATLPSLLYEIETPDFDGIYLTRPVQYPDGKWYLKMGMNQENDLCFEALDEVTSWFQGNTHEILLPQLKSEIVKLFPDIDFLSFQTKPCVISRTVTKNPYIGAVADRLLVATGCNGYSAMTSDAQGRIAATLALTGSYPEGYSAADFKVFTR